MTHATAKFIIYRHGLACLNVRELSDLLTDRFMPLPGQVKEAILTLRHPVICGPVASQTAGRTSKP